MKFGMNLLLWTDTLHDGLLPVLWRDRDKRLVDALSKPESEQNRSTIRFSRMTPRVDFGRKPSGPPTFKNRQAPRVFNFALQRATWRRYARPDLITRVPVPSRGQIDLEGFGSSSRPCLVKTTRRTVLWHPEQLKVWCSKPRTVTVFSGTTFVRISSASHAVQCIPRTPLASAHLLSRI